MTAEEKDQVLKENHPDYREDQFDVLSVGPNKGEKAPKELVKMLQSDSRLKDNLPDLSCPDYETDVLIIGGGGARCICCHRGRQRRRKGYDRNQAAYR